jgi:hypothetical protein
VSTDSRVFQQKLGAVVNAFPVNAIPLKYEEDTVHEEATPLEYKEDTVHKEASEIQGNEREKTSADPSLNCVVPSERDQHQEVRMSTRKRRPLVKLSKHFL